MGPMELDLKFALVVGLAAAAMVAYLLVLIAGARAFELVHRIRRSQFVDNWDDVLAGNRTAVAASIARLRIRDTQSMLERWNEAYRDRPEDFGTEEARESERSRLRRIGEQAGIAEAAFVLLTKSGRERHVAAITALGFLRTALAWNTLVPLVRERDPYISLAALQALVRIDELRAAPFLTTHFSAHPDWPEHAVATLIGEVSEVTRQTLVLYALDEPMLECRARIFAGLEQIAHSGADRLLDHVLEHGTSVDEITRHLYATRREHHIERIGQVLREGRLRARQYAVRMFAPESAASNRWETEPPWVRALAAESIAWREDAPTFR